MRWSVLGVVAGVAIGVVAVVGAASHSSALISSSALTALGGKPYEPGEFCPKADLGLTTTSGDGATIECESINSSYHWAIVSQPPSPPATVPEFPPGTIPYVPVPTGDGYWAVASDGGIFSQGGAPFYGSVGGRHLNQAIVGVATTADGRGYWEVASDGGIFAFGDAHFYGSTGGRYLNQPIVGMTATPDGKGYYLVASDGGIFDFGDAKFRGSEGGDELNQPIVGMAAGPRGYTLVAADGGVFNFGTNYYGSEGGHPLNEPIVGIIAAADGRGYTEIAADGGNFTFGPDAPFYGSVPGLDDIVNDVVGGTSLADGGYVDFSADGFSFWFSSNGMHGVQNNYPLTKPFVGGTGV